MNQTWRNLSVDRLDVSVRACNAIKRLGLRTIGEVQDSINERPWEFLRLPNCGRTTMERLIKALRHPDLSQGSALDMAIERMEMTRAQIEAWEIKLAKKRVELERLENRVAALRVK